MSNFALQHSIVSRLAPACDVLAATLEDPASSSGAARVPGDPLVNQTWANLTHIGAIVLVVCLIVLVGIVSKRVEHAIVFALIASLVMIGFFLLVGR